MAKQQLNLALSFLQSHPASAAATLEQHPIEDVARFLEEVPATISVLVVQNLLPHFASRICKLLPTTVVAGIFNELGIGQAAAILRHYSRESRVEILDELPTKIQLGCTLLLDYSADMVGAWITPQVATIPYDYSVIQAFNHVNETTEIVQSDSLFVISRERNFKGRLKLIDLIRAPDNMPISDLTTNNGELLKARVRLTEVELHKDWKRFHEIPVVNRNQKFIGVLCHTELRKGLDQLKPDDNTLIRTDTNETISVVYGEAMLAIAESMTEILKLQKPSA